MIYIHVPFCRSFCTYCDFYSEIVCRGRDSSSLQDYARDLLAEIEARRAEITASLELNTLYIGGGTPSVLPIEFLGQIVDALGCGPYKEFTVEVNPEDIMEKGPEYLEGLKALGVTRISIGVQSLDDGILEWMNRRHNADHARRAFRMLPGGLDRSVDIITGVPGMSDGSLAKTMDEIISWRPEHISAYQLSVEDGSALAKMIASGKLSEAPEEQCRRQYEMLCSKLHAAGYRHYEISNWALPGHEAVHNSAYWTRKPYVGLGPGAHSLRIGADGTQTRSWNSRSAHGWKAAGSETLGAREIREETIMLGLRTYKGAEIDGRHVSIPEKDWFIADDIISGLI